MPPGLRTQRFAHLRASSYFFLSLLLPPPAFPFFPFVSAAGAGSAFAGLPLADAAERMVVQTILQVDMYRTCRRRGTTLRVAPNEVSLFSPPARPCREGASRGWAAELQRTRS